MAEFRKASEDFKRTWEREVALESARLETTENSILDTDTNDASQASQLTESPQPWIEPVAPDHVVARQNQPAPPEPEPVPRTENTSTPATPEPLRKHDWL